MSTVQLSDSFITVLLSAGKRALARRDRIRVDDLLAGLLEVDTGGRIATAIDAPMKWPTPETLAESATDLEIYVEETVLGFDRPAQALVLLGAERVLLGEYEPRHLAQAIGETAETTRAPFARFGLDPRAWRQALLRNP